MTDQSPAPGSVERVRDPATDADNPQTRPDQTPDLSSEDWGALSPAGRLAFRRLQQEDRKWATELERVHQWDRLLSKAPDLVKQVINAVQARGTTDARTRALSLGLHLGVLLLGTATAVILGVTQVLSAETITAILGPLYTYVLVNLRYLTPRGRQPAAGD